jgi:hypothetical protein
MIGQGRPNNRLRARSGELRRAPDRAALAGLRATRRGDVSRALFAIALTLAANAVCDAAAPLAITSGETSMRLRIEWGGGTARRWQGSATLADGSISEPVPLGIEADEPGSMWIERGALCVRARSARTYDGVDVTVNGPATAALELTLSDRSAAAPTGVSVPLSQVLHDVFTVPLDAAGNRLLVRRVPGDRVRVKLARDSVIYSAGEVAEIEVSPHLVPGGANRVLLVAQLFPARSTRDPVWSAEQELTLSPEGTAAEPAVLAVKLPESEGVYDLRLTLHRRALQNRLGWKQTVEERKVQLLVLEAKRPIPGGAAPLPAVAETLFEMDPASPSWWERWGSAPSIPGLRRGPLGNGDAKTRQHPLGTLIEIGPGGREPNVSWEAYPLPVARPGQPHVVEVEYPTDVAQTMGISIIEPNVAGKITPIGLDAGVYLPEEAIDRESRLARHRLIFWPRTKAPLLLVTNQRDGSRAVFGKVRLIGPKPSVASNLRLDSGRPAYLPRAFPASQPAGDRLLAGYYDRPLFTKNLSASEAFDEWSGRGLDDWVTFYEGATRLVEYLEHFGYNGLMITVLADGSTIYPSRLLQPTPRYDSGAYFATGQDPYRKDVLELLFRLFDRQGMKLIPALQFSAPLPELEAHKRRGGQAADTVEPLDSQGQAWLAEHETRAGLAPYYNPLEVHVQDAMLGVVRELCERYAQHESFSSLAVQLSADGYAQLPGADWGYDEKSVGQFAREKGIRALEGQNLQTQIKLSATEYRGAWLEWRCQAVAQLHKRVHSELARVKDNQPRLYLVGAHLFERPDIEQLLRPTLPARTSVEQQLVTMGIDPKLYQSTDAIVLVRPQWIEPLNSLAGQGADLELNQSIELDRDLRARASAAALFFHKPQQLHVPSFDAKSPFKGAQTLVLGQPTPAGSLNRRRFVHAMATLDAQAMIDGGRLLPLGEEDSLVELVAAYRELPAAPFETVDGATQPVTIRRRTGPQGTYVYFTNDSPWHVVVNVEVDAPAECQLDRFGNSRRLPALSPSGAGPTWKIEMQPYELLAGRFSAADVVLRDPRVSFVDDVENELYGRIRDLGERISLVQQPNGLKKIVNPGFEQAPTAADPLPGWQMREQLGATAEIDAEQKVSGAQSLRFTSTQAAASLTSAPFTALGSGHLSVLARLRVADETRQPPLRLAISARWNGQDYYRYAPVGAGTRQAIGGQWTQYLFQVRDLPVDQLSDLRVRFDLTSPGEVWIDDVEVRELDDEEIRELQKMTTVAIYALDAGHLGDCLRLLEGYWPRFLVANVPLEPGPIAARPRYVSRRTEAAAPAEPEAKPGMMERMRRAMPSFLR